MTLVIILLFLIFLCVLPRAVWRGLGSLISFAILLWLLNGLLDHPPSWLVATVSVVQSVNPWMVVFGVIAAVWFISAAFICFKQVRGRAGGAPSVAGKQPIDRAQLVGDEVGRAVVRFVLGSRGQPAKKPPERPEHQPIPAEDRTRQLGALLDSHGRRR